MLQGIPLPSWRGWRGASGNRQLCGQFHGHRDVELGVGAISQHIYAMALPQPAKRAGLIPAARMRQLRALKSAVIIGATPYTLILTAGVAQW